MGLHSDLLEKIIAFRDERDWQQFHNPKDLAAGLAIEAAELQEIFLWKSPDELAETIAAKKNELSEELADITWFVLLLAHELNIDLNDAVEDKLQKNAAKYPADKVRGSSKKYDEYDDDQSHTDR
jgi:NTP pyrophosphatase (non-canonical NTP hydrolase)